MDNVHLKTLVETAEAYLLVNGDDGVLEDAEKTRIQAAIDAAKAAMD